jgi:hypothetical protein
VKLKLAATAAALMIAGSSAVAQKPQISMTLPDPALRAAEPPGVRSHALVTDETTTDLLRNGFPARLHYRIERWSTGGWFDDIAAEAEWDVVVRYDALSKQFQVYRVVARKTVLLGPRRAARGRGEEADGVNGFGAKSIFDVVPGAAQHGALSCAMMRC